jgi:hypothetical protein
LSIPSRATAWPDQCAGLKTGALCPHSIATPTRYPAITGGLHMGTVACQGALRMSGGSLPPQLAPAFPRCGARGGPGRRTSPQDRRTAPRRCGCLCPGAAAPYGVERVEIVTGFVGQALALHPRQA